MWCPEQENGKGSPPEGTADTCLTLGTSLLAGFRSPGFVIFVIEIPAPYSARYTVTAPRLKYLLKQVNHCPALFSLGLGDSSTVMDFAVTY